jgi:ATP-dependent DNA helicase RecG
MSIPQRSPSSLRDNHARGTAGDFVKKQLPEKYFTEDGQRKDLRDLIFREVIGNLIVHREYTNEISTEIVILKDRVVCTNPTKPHFHGPIDPTKFSPYPKNPNIRKFFTAFGWTDELGSGVRNTYKYLPLYVAEAEPSFREDEIFTTELPMLRALLGDHAESLLKWLELSSDATAHVREGLGKVTLDPALSGATWNQVLAALVPSWNAAGAKLGHLDWAEYEGFTKNNGAKVPSHAQKVPSAGTGKRKPMQKKFRYLISILILSAESVKLEQMMAWIGYKNRQTFRESYLIPLMRSGLVEMTNPENPRAKNQQYILKPAGHLFLAGRTN